MHCVSLPPLTLPDIQHDLSLLSWNTLLLELPWHLSGVLLQCSSSSSSAVAGFFKPHFHLSSLYPLFVSAIHPLTLFSSSEWLQMLTPPAQKSCTLHNSMELSHQCSFHLILHAATQSTTSLEEAFISLSRTPGFPFLSGMLPLSGDSSLVSSLSTPVENTK